MNRTQQVRDEIAQQFESMWQAPQTDQTTAEQAQIAKHNAQTVAELNGSDALFDVVSNYIGTPEDMQDVEYAVARFRENLPALRLLLIEIQPRLTAYGKVS